MKKKRNSQKKTKTGMRTEYDFSAGTRGRYAKRYLHSNNLVKLGKRILPSGA